MARAVLPGIYVPPCHLVVIQHAQHVSSLQIHIYATSTDSTVPYFTYMTDHSSKQMIAALTITICNTIAYIKIYTAP